MTQLATIDPPVSSARKPVKKSSSSKKTTTKKVQPKATEAKATRAADIAKSYNLDPKKLRKALRDQNIRAPYDAAAILKIEKLAKELAFVS